MAIQDEPNGINPDEARKIASLSDPLLFEEMHEETLSLLRLMAKGDWNVSSISEELEPVQGPVFPIDEASIRLLENWGRSDTTEYAVIKARLDAGQEEILQAFQMMANLSRKD